MLVTRLNEESTYGYTDFAGKFHNHEYKVFVTEWGEKINVKIECQEDYSEDMKNVTLKFFIVCPKFFGSQNPEGGFNSLSSEVLNPETEIKALTKMVMVFIKEWVKDNQSEDCFIDFSKRKKTKDLEFNFRFDHSWQAYVDFKCPCKVS